MPYNKNNKDNDDSLFADNGPTRVRNLPNQTDENIISAAESIHKIHTAEDNQNNAPNTENLIHTKRRKSLFVPGVILENKSLVGIIFKNTKKVRKTLLGILIAFSLLVFIFGAMLYLYPSGGINKLITGAISTASNSSVLAKYSERITNPIKNNIVLTSETGSVITKTSLANHIAVDYARIPYSVIAALGMAKVARKVPPNTDYDTYFISTITAELAYSFLRNDFNTKIPLADVINSILAKNTADKILAYYLSASYFGMGIVGIEDASVAYFAKPYWSLDLAESVSLVAIMQLPLYNPLLFPNSVKTSSTTILKDLLNAKFITLKDYYAAETKLSRVFDNANPVSASSIVPVAVDEVYTNLPSGFLPENLILTTTIDPTIQAKLENQSMATLKNYSLQRITKVSSIVVGKGGEIKALHSLSDNQNNFPQLAYNVRQSGNIFNLFKYIALASQGYQSQSIVEQSTQTSSKVANLNLSNMVINRVASSLGILNLYQSENILSGTKLISLKDVVSSYSVLTNNGTYNRAFLVIKASNNNKQEFFSYAYNPPAEVVSQNALNTTLEVLFSRKIMNVDIPLRKIKGGVGGLSPDNNTAWFVGYGNGMLVGGWVASNNTLPLRVNNANIVAGLLDASIN